MSPFDNCNYCFPFPSILGNYVQNEIMLTFLFIGLATNTLRCRNIQNFVRFVSYHDMEFPVLL